MSDVFRFTEGTIPLLMSSPHSGTDVPADIEHRFTEDARRLPDTDWHIPLLYDFAAGLGASRIEAVYSRYVVDLNRPPDNQSLYPGQATTGLCPVQQFDGEAIYQEGNAPEDGEVAERTEKYWRPYHAKIEEELNRLKSAFGYALLYDCHSIRSAIPRLFDGRLPTLNLGTNRGASCDPRLEQAIAEEMAASSFTQVVNGRFVGGHITRGHGRPENNIHAVQMELTQIDYMDEHYPFAYAPERAQKLQQTLRPILEAFIASGARLFGT